MRGWAKKWGRAGVLAWLACFALPAAAQQTTSEEVEASYLLQLHKFVQVGAPRHAVHLLCYYEKPGVSPNESVGQILTRYIQKNPLQAGDDFKVEWRQDLTDFNGCDMLYIPSEEEGNIDTILTRLGNQPTLTVSGAKRFIFRGGMIGFISDDSDHIRMEGNLKNINAGNIYVDTQVLEVMQHVVRE